MNSVQNISKGIVLFNDEVTDQTSERPATLSDLSRVQLKLREREKKHGILFPVMAYSWLNGWTSQSLGYYSLLRILKIPFHTLDFLKLLLDHLYLCFFGYRYELILPNLPTHPTALVFSWCIEKDIPRLITEKKDRYLGSFDGKQNLNLLRIYTLLGDFTPEEEKGLLASGAAFLKRKRDLFRPFRLPYLLANHMMKGELRWNDLAFAFSNDFFEGEMQWRALQKSELNFKTTKSVFFAYEAQPLQHRLLLEFQKYPNLTTVGYMHSALPPLPSDMIYRAGAPELLLVNGKAQKRILETSLGWNPDNVKVIDSIRFAVSNENHLESKILLPHTFADTNHIIQSLRVWLKSLKEGSVFPLSVRVHPSRIHLKKHQEAQLEIEKTLEDMQSKFSSAGEKYAVVVGASAAVVEALELGLRVIHIVEKPLLEAHAEEIWTEIGVNMLSKSTYEYTLKDPGALIQQNLTKPNSVINVLEMFSLC